MESFPLEVFIAIALILGDGLYNLIKIISIMLNEICNESSKQNNLPSVKESLDGQSSEETLEIKGDEVFLKDRIPKWVACSGVAISTVTMPIIFLPLKWYLVLCSYILVPALAFCNSYGTNLTDWSLASTYGKIGLVIIASSVGSDGGVIAGLAARGVMVSSCLLCTADLMQDFKTGLPHYTFGHVLCLLASWWEQPWVV